MANEVKVNISLDVTNGDYNDKVAPGVLQFDQAAQGVFRSIVSIPTSDTAITISNITTEGWAYFRNLDDTNYVEHGPDSGGALVPYGRMEAGEPAALRLTPGSLTVRMQANTAACDVLVIVHEY